jgi:hypothetical protein
VGGCFIGGTLFLCIQFLMCFMPLYCAISPIIVALLYSCRHGDYIARPCAVDGSIRILLEKKFFLLQVSKFDSDELTVDPVDFLHYKT